MGFSGEEQRDVTAASAHTSAGAFRLAGPGCYDRLGSS